MEMQFKNEINKLADIVVWADGIIRDAGYNEEKYKSDAATAYCHVKAYELWRIRDVALESIDRHAVYTNALNKDIADKAAKIELLEKEIEGRKEGYIALKKRMDTDYISIEEHNNICEDFKKKIAELEEKVKHQRENLDGINKTLEIRNKENDSLVKTIQTTRREIEAHESENKRLTEKIAELKKERDKHMARVNDLRMELDCVKASKEKHEEAAHDKVVEGLRETISYWRNKYVAAQEARDAFMKENTYLKNELEKTYKDKEADLKNHQKRDMALVDELAKKNDEIKKLKEDVEALSVRVDTDFVNKLIQETDYYKDQERIRTDQLRATESKVEELYKQIEGLTNNCRSKSTEMARLRKEMADIKHERSKEDDHGKSGFKRYIEHLIEEEERAVPERFKERLNEEITAIFTKEEETEVKGNGRTNSGRYPWGAKVNDIPCGEDSIE